MAHYDCIVIGAGHAGCEAAHAAATIGSSTLLLSQNLDAVARMSCNPAIGGLAKGQIVREVDALGGLMGRVTDIAGLQFRMLNRSKGEAVWSPRAQCDKHKYSSVMKQRLENTPNLQLLQGEVTELIVENMLVKGVVLKTGERITAQSVILTAGTFLQGLIHVGLTHFPGGRFGEPEAAALSTSLGAIGFEIKRMKTGTPPRINGNTMNLSVMSEQPGDMPPVPFSHFTHAPSWAANRPQLPCWLTYTNAATHDVIRKNMHRSPLYSGIIKSTGPRYCPSIEDKVVRFAERERHQVFLEPEGFETQEFYANGISTSLPQDVQYEIVHSITGLENARIMRYGYAIEYDYFPPLQLKPTMETKLIENLYFAGQVNGTTGYEEAAAQGLMAGINAGLKHKGLAPLILRRDEAYIGVMIDDLVTKGVDEPYRMFTSRAEHRLYLRSDNADLRLMETGHRIGLIGNNDMERFSNYRDAVAALMKKPENAAVDETTLVPWTTEQAVFEAEVMKKYAGYINRQSATAERIKRMDDKRIPESFNYDLITNLLTEARQKLKRVQPRTLGQASRIPGVTPADVAILMVQLAKRN